MENQSLSSSSFAFPHDLNSVVVAVEGEAMNNLERDNIDFSQRGFPSLYAQAGQQTYQDNSGLLFGGSTEDILSDNNILGLMGARGSVYRSLDAGVTRGVMDLNMAPYPSFIYNSVYSFPLRYGEGVSSRNAYPFFDGGVREMNMNMFPLPSNNYGSNDDICLDLTLGPSKSTGGSNNYRPNDICLDLTLGPSKTTGGSEPSNNYRPNDICLDLTLGPSKSTGGSNNYRSNDDICLDLTLGPSKTTGGSEPSHNYRPNDICLDLTLGPSKSTEVTRGTTNVNNLVRPGTTSLCNDMFWLQENGSCL